MTVQELFKEIDRKNFIDKYLEYCGNPRSIKERRKVTKLLNTLDKIDIVPNDSWIVFCEQVIGEDYLDSTIVKKEDLLNAKIETGEIPDGYAYELHRITDILGYSVSFACIYAFGVVKVACAILDEITLFGYDINTQQENVKIEIAQLQKSIEEIDNGEAKLTSFTDLCKKYDLIDDRKMFEKDFDSAKAQIDCESFKKLKQELCKLEISYLLETV